MDDEPLQGRADRVIRRLIEGGDTENALDLIKMLLDGDGHDISIAFRACLIGQGFEAQAMQINQAMVHFHDRGFMLQIDPVNEGTWTELETSPELKAAMDTALVWIMRGANMDAYLDNGKIRNRGKIRPDGPEDVEALVGRFVEEIDEQFPDTPPKREGKWW